MKLYDILKAKRYYEWILEKSGYQIYISKYSKFGFYIEAYNSVDAFCIEYLYAELDKLGEDRRLLNLRLIGSFGNITKNIYAKRKFLFITNILLKESDKEDIIKKYRYDDSVEIIDNKEIIIHVDVPEIKLINRGHKLYITPSDDNYDNIHINPYDKLEGRCEVVEIAKKMGYTYWPEYQKSESEMINKMQKWQNLEECTSGCILLIFIAIIIKIFMFTISTPSHNSEKNNIIYKNKEYRQEVAQVKTEKNIKSNIVVKKTVSFEELSQKKQNLFFLIMNYNGVDNPTDEDYNKYIEIFEDANDRQVERLLREHYNIDYIAFITTYGDKDTRTKVLEKYKQTKK